ncbi:DivIVA domain-containing protein [Lactobacillus ultunensis]|uniref:DivIVA domain protein n=1 Tax=Lactobacillus ultunensis DSM 16047 TaxID=525365 RepID=C2EMH0_9LACO|nr:DivIVA domain-containing protein [Lactobacillus ultunensis]EEJ72179.1 DivIVA domain protein [Lactobacillus ultunensis DSM 16047]
MADKKIQLTPMDIHNKEFKRRGRNGYDRYEVDSFLDDIVDDYGDALDQVVDLKNEVVSLKDQIKNLQIQVDEYNDKKKSLKESLISAQQTSDEMKEKAEEEAKSILVNAKRQAETDTDYQKQQKNTISKDYKRLKKQISEFRSHMQAMLQEEIDNLNDDQWQHALDEYFHLQRFYPGDGAEPIDAGPETQEEEFAREAALDDEDVDNDDENDVNSSQESDDLSLDPPDDSDDDQNDSKPKPMTGDSPSHETINLKPDNDNKLGPMIVFPDDYKK